MVAVINIRGIVMRYVLVGLLCLLALQGCESGSGGSSVGSGPVQGQNRDGAIMAADMAGDGRPHRERPTGRSRWQAFNACADS